MLQRLSRPQRSRASAFEETRDHLQRLHQQPPSLVPEPTFDAGDSLMAWVTSLLADYPGTVDTAWLQPAVTVADFFAPFVRSAKTYVQPKVRAEFEAAIGADRKLIEDTMQAGDVLRPWWVG